MVECTDRTREVRGSNPLISRNFKGVGYRRLFSWGFRYGGFPIEQPSIYSYTCLKAEGDLISMETNALVPSLDNVVASLKAHQQKEQLETAKRLLEDVEGSVVKVTADGKGCDGFFINDGTRIVTSNDLFQTPGSGRKIEITTSTGQVLKGHIESQSDDHEEVIVKLDGVKPNDFKGLQICPTDELYKRQRVFLYGHRDWQSEPVLAIGSVQDQYDIEAQGFASEAKPTKVHRFIDCVMPAEVGLSGTPLLNEDGEVIGMYQMERKTAPHASNNVLVRCDDVSELKEMLPGHKTDAEESGDKPSAEQSEAILKRLGKLTKQTVIEFEADWCGYCKLQKPLLEKAQKKYGEDLNVVRLNFDNKENAELAKAYGIKGLPFAVFIGVSPEGELLRQETCEGFSPGAFQQLINQLMDGKAKDKPGP